MRKAAILIISAGVALAWVGPASSAPKSSRSGGSGGESNQQASPALTNLLRENPEGGEGLSAPIARMLAADPSTVDAIVALAKAASPDQKAAIALGILRVLHRTQTSPEMARTIRAALQRGDPVFRAVLAALESQIYAQNGQTSDEGRGSLTLGAGGGGAFGVGFAGPPPQPTFQLTPQPPPVSPN